MCGIAGIFSLNSLLNDDDLREARQMTAILRHRGPDDMGFYNDDRCVLGTTRLKIIDLSDNANMPMTNEDGTIWLTYNGEVTNYRELREQFKLDEKHRFRSTSDTEVLIHLYEELGIECLKHLTGYFAFGLYDKRLKKAYVVRDFYGIRPLFFLTHGDRLYFSSEMKSFMDLGCFNGEINYEAFYHYFSLVYIPDRLTPFVQIQELDGGWLIEVDLDKGQMQKREYYKIRFEPDDSMTEKETAKALHDLMTDSVRRNLISDAPLGLTLSGGFDTSSILSITKKLGLSGDIHTFSIIMGESSFSEERYQKIMVDFARPIHHAIYVGPNEVAENLVIHNAFLDEPTGDGSTLPTFILAKEAKKYVSVLLSGEGGDEVFNAYETHVAYKVRKLYRKLVNRHLREAIRFVINKLPTDYKKLSFDFLAKRFSEGAELDVPEAHFYWRHALSDAEKERLMPNYAGYKPTYRFFSDLYNSLDYPEGLDRISHIDLKYFFIDDLMVKNDRMMMAHSVEARFPWVDRPLVEFMNRVPARLRIKRFTRRYIQKQAMKDYIPKAIYRRSNMGLEMPHALWFLKELKPIVEQYFSKRNVEKTNFLSYDAIQTMWGEHVSRKKDHGRSLWAILNFLIWFDLYVWNKDFKKYLTLG